MNIKQALQYASTRFKTAGIESANIDARLLLSHTIDKQVEYQLLYLEQNLSDSEQENFLKLVEERSSLKPIAYILGYREFYGREFKLNDQVLIPRPDTETLIEAVLSRPQASNSRILELGVGSGCIIITLLLEIPNATGIGLDINDEALTMTQQNALIYKVDNRLQLIKSNWFANIDEQKFNIIVCNPPYISLQDKNIMAKETILYEPKQALFAENEGLDAYKIIAKSAHNFLEISGALFLEVGFKQANKVAEIFCSEGYILAASFKDLNEYIRVLCFKLCD